jgi:hypothetical protein
VLPFEVLLSLWDLFVRIRMSFENGKGNIALLATRTLLSYTRWKRLCHHHHYFQLIKKTSFAVTHLLRADSQFPSNKGVFLIRSKVDKIFMKIVWMPLSIARLLIVQEVQKYLSNADGSENIYLCLWFSLNCFSCGGTRSFYISTASRKVSVMDRITKQVVKYQLWIGSPSKLLSHSHWSDYC